MPMRVDCKFYESRTYSSGETVRMCRLNLAPEAPWRCPEECAGYRKRMVDVGWNHGSLIADAGPAEPASLETDAAAALLEQAEDILNAAGPQIVAEVAKQKAKKKKWRRRK